MRESYITGGPVPSEDTAFLLAQLGQIGEDPGGSSIPRSSTLFADIRHLEGVLEDLIHDVDLDDICYGDDD